MGDDERARALASLAGFWLVEVAAVVSSGWTDLAFVMLMPKQLHHCTLPILGCTHHHHHHRTLVGCSQCLCCFWGYVSMKSEG